MVGTLLMFSLGFLWHMLKGELPISVVGATLVLGLLFTIFGEWGHLRSQRLKTEGEWYSQGKDRGLLKIIGEGLIIVASTFIVVGFVYGAFQVGAKPFSAWGWPILTSTQLARLSLTVVGCALVGVIMLGLLRKKYLYPDGFWISFTLVWAMLSACATKWAYPLPSKTISISQPASLAPYYAFCLHICSNKNMRQ
ncbi:hypothetical protein [Paenibacillus sp.]|jgi:hypothetical protein|uniref:hypothetical protein n=1 Tax=Paenibacillus sp. TaxID=58172 RepID=UPI0028369630|nr:hypothetical protein [Paenibacillus sp.]MDR0270978.1 hypothetical protein [Paenibacillus sp.]